MHHDDHDNFSEVTQGTNETRKAAGSPAAGNISTTETEIRHLSAGKEYSINWL